MPRNPEESCARVSIESLLNELIATVEGATGAIIVAGDGEAIQWCATSEVERLRLRGAYVAVVMHTFRTAASRANLGRLKHFVVNYDGASLVAYEIDDDCCVVLELKPREILGKVIYQLRAAAKKLSDEF
jgi:predicted regulator of Ras-like GTPase activity (Roadblock/LC7/MglB family)